VLRSACRFFLHIGDPERAHDLISKSPASKDDPWLVSAEIALADIASRTPLFARIGLRLLESDNFSERQLSELASSLATLELDGSRKKMFQLFKKSLQNPTGNALAQAAWVEPIARIELFESKEIAAKEFEASAHRYYHQGSFAKALQFCNSWITEEAYSSRPYQFGAATAGALDDFDAAIELADKGLRIDKNSTSLKLSKIYALAISRKTVEAQKLINSLKNESDKPTQAILKANEGLVAFRAGQSLLGKELYFDALQQFKKLGDHERLKIASAYLAREATLVNDSDAEKLFASAMQFNSSGQFPHISKIVLAFAGKKLGQSRAANDLVEPKNEVELRWSTHLDSGIVQMPAKRL
jgi:tetratricopeptide (TPR) repeat protein